jgi:hypothetical protein
MNEIASSVLPPVRGLEKEEPELAEELDIPTDDDLPVAADEEPREAARK